MRPPGYPYSTLRVNREIMNPLPRREDCLCNFVNIPFFYFCFEKTNQANLFVMQDLQIFLFIGLIQAPDVPVYYVIHGDQGRVDPPLRPPPRLEKSCVGRCERCYL